MDQNYIGKIGEVLVKYDKRDGLYNFSISSHDQNELNRGKKFFQFEESVLETIPKNSEELAKYLDHNKDSGHGLSDIELKSISYAIKVASEKHYGVCGP